MIYLKWLLIMTKNLCIPLAQKELISILFIGIIIVRGTAYAEIQNCDVGDTTEGQWVTDRVYNCAYSWTGGCSTNGYCYDDETIGSYRIVRQRVVGCIFADEIGQAFFYGDCFGNELCNNGCEPTPSCGGGRSIILEAFTYGATLYRWQCNPQPPEPVEMNYNIGPPTCQ
jgi:hypothetical protein